MRLSTRCRSMRKVSSSPVVRFLFSVLLALKTPQQQHSLTRIFFFFLFFAGDNGSLTLWDYNSGTPFQNMDDIPQPGSLEAEAGIFCSTFDMTGTRLITGGADKTIKVKTKNYLSFSNTKQALKLFPGLRRTIRWTLIRVLLIDGAVERERRTDGIVSCSPPPPPRLTPFGRTMYNIWVPCCVACASPPKHKRVFCILIDDPCSCQLPIANNQSKRPKTMYGTYIYTSCTIASCTSAIRFFFLDIFFWI